MFSDWKQKITPPNGKGYIPPQKVNIKNRTYQPIQPSEVQSRQGPSTLVNTPTVPNKVMRWGAPTWTLFHTLAQKIEEKHFSRLSRELFDLIKTVCYTLPCPDCANHASEYISKINWNLIQTKKQLIDLLWQFHNDVNRRKGYPFFPNELLESTYGNKNLTEVVHVFMYYYEDKKSKGPNSAIASKFHRQQIAGRLKSWFNVNYQYFLFSIPPLSD